MQLFFLPKVVRYLRRLYQSAKVRRCNEFGMKQGREKTVTVTDSDEVRKP